MGISCERNEASSGQTDENVSVGAAMTCRVEVHMRTPQHPLAEQTKTKSINSHGKPAELAWKMGTMVSMDANTNANANTNTNTNATRTNQTEPNRTKASKSSEEKKRNEKDEDRKANTDIMLSCPFGRNCRNEGWRPVLRCVYAFVYLCVWVYVLSRMCVRVCGCGWTCGWTCPSGKGCQQEQEWLHLCRWPCLYFWYSAHVPFSTIVNGISLDFPPLFFVPFFFFVLFFFFMVHQYRPGWYDVVDSNRRLVTTRRFYDRESLPIPRQTAGWPGNTTDVPSWESKVPLPGRQRRVHHNEGRYGLVRIRRL